MAIKGNIPDIGKAYIMEIGKRLEEEKKARKEGDNKLEGAVKEEARARKEGDDKLKEEFQKALSEFGNSVIEDIVIPKAAWVKEGDIFLAFVEKEAAKSNRFPITVIWDESSDCVKKADMSHIAESADGKIIFRAGKIPENDIYTTVAFLYPKEVIENGNKEN